MREIFEGCGRPVRKPRGRSRTAPKLQMTRAKFEDLNAKVFSSTIEPIAQVLKDAKLEKSKVDEIVLVGGSTRIPRIQKLLSDYFDGKKL